MNAPRDKSYDDSLMESLKNPIEAAAYIEAVIDLDEPAALLVALRHVAKAHGRARCAARGGWVRRCHVGKRAPAMGDPM